MNMQEMVMALFAIVFFTTIALVYSRSMWDTAEALDDGSKVIQATHLAHSKLDEIDAKLFSHQIAFNAVINNFTGTQTVDQAYTGYKYFVTYSFKYCDSLGVNLGSQAYQANPFFYKMTITVAADHGMKVPVVVTRLFNKIDLYN